MAKGSIYRRKDGRYEARLSLGSFSGKRHQISFYGKTMDEAGNKLKNYYHQLLMEETGDGRPQIKVSELCSEWLVAMQNHLKISTMANYRMKIEKHILPAFGSDLCSKVTSAAVQAFINKKIESGLSGRYVSDIIVLIKTVFRYARAQGYAADPLGNIIMPKCKTPDVRILTPDQQNTLKTYIFSKQTLTHAGIAFALFMGLRIGEVCGLKWSDIDFEKRTLTVRRTVQRVSTGSGKTRTKLVVMPPKSESSHREIPLPGRIYDALLALRSEKVSINDDYFIVSGTMRPTEPRAMQYRFAAILKNAELPSCTFHSLRHAMATAALAAGFDVKTLSEILGHSKIEITLARYVHSSIDRKRECMRLIS